jgi:type 1 fimbria pilin
MVPHARLLALFVLLLAAPRPAFAEIPCKLPPAQGSPQHVSFGVVHVPDTAPVGQLLATRRSQAWSSAQFHFCGHYTRTFTLGAFAGPALGDGVYASNVPGVGVRIRFHYHAGEYILPFSHAYQAPPLGPKLDLAMLNASFTVDLVKTGPVGDGGTLTPGRIANAGYDNKPLVSLDLGDARVEPQRPTCTFQSRRLLFDLGKVDGGALAAEGHSHWATQELVVTGCANATHVLMRFAGVADETDPALFKLDAAGAARGVAVELRANYLDTRIVPNDPKPLELRVWPHCDVCGFRARYRTTGTVLAPGSANAHITVDVAYR